MTGGQVTKVSRWLLEHVLPPLVFFVIVLSAWQAATMFWKIPVYLVPTPARVLEAAREHTSELISATQLTAGGALFGFLLSLIVGTVLGLIFSQSKIIQRSIYPYAIFLQTVPIVALAPLVINWFGTGFGSVVVVSFILSLFPIVTNATAGLTTVEPQLIELFEIHNASRWQELLKLRLPNAVPSLVTGMKISCGLSVIGAIVGEIFAGYGTQRYGLGYLITLTTGKLETAYAFAAVLCSTLLSVAIFVAINLIGSSILARWHVSEPRSSTATSE